MFPYHVYSILPHVLIAMFFFCAGVDPDRSYQGEHLGHGDQRSWAGHQVLYAQDGGREADLGEAAPVDVACHRFRAAGASLELCVLGGSGGDPGTEPPDVSLA